VETSETIRIVIYGLAVEQPGTYFLENDTTVLDAFEAAHGRTDFVRWRKHQSGVQRLRSDGARETIWFTKEGRILEEAMPLQDGDWLRFVQEKY
jgi:protein involved in polysaccharide export with SLBB domain